MFKGKLRNNKNNQSDSDEDSNTHTDKKSHNVNITLNGKGINSADYEYKGGELTFKNDGAGISGGFIGSLLASLIPLGVDLFTGLLGKKFGGNGIAAMGISAGDLKKKIHNVKISNKAGDHLKTFKVCTLGGALLSDSKFFKELLGARDLLQEKKTGKGLYAAGLYAKGISAGKMGGGSIGGNSFINE